MLPQGPRPTGTEPIPVTEGEIEIVTRGAQRVLVPGDALRGILGPFNGRARSILLSLLGGHSMGMASAGAGISKNTLDRWRQSDPAFGEAVTLAYDIGFSAGIEAEAYDRAMDRTDRASGRLLELILKARSPDYREKSQLQLEVVARVGSALDTLVGGWTPEPAAPDSIEGS